MKVSVYAILSVCVLLGFSCKTQQGAQQMVIPSGGQKVAAPTPPPPPATPVVEPEVKKEEPKPELPEVKEVKEEQFEIAEGEEKDLLKYHVVVGSFKNKINAQNLQNKLIQEKNKALIVINEIGMYRVLIASYETYEQARYKRKTLMTAYPGVWLLVQKQ